MSTDRDWSNMLNEQVKVGLPKTVLSKKKRKLKVASIDDLKKLRDALPKGSVGGLGVKLEKGC
jgi:hypothetical protein